jgi:DnaJ-class molecular chaperone
MPTAKDYYKILGVQRNASQDEIRKAYRNLAREKHPDMNKADGAAEEFARISEAYEVLSDEKKRQAYDRFGAAGVDGGGQSAGRRPQGWSSSGSSVDPADLGTIFEEMFGGRGAGVSAGPASGAGSGFGRSPFGGGGSTSAGAAPRGADRHHKITVTFLTALRGGTEQVRLGGPNRDQTIEVKIPAGIESGAKLRIRGRGGATAPGASPGDLILTIEVGGHPYLRREGMDLLVDVPITFTEAALGTSIDVPLIEGTARVKIPPGTSSGSKLRLKDKGIKAADGRQGDLYAVIQIAAPKDLSPEQRQLLVELGAELQNPRDSAPWDDSADKQPGGGA